MERNSDIYICSKPLQFFNIKNIPYENLNRILVIVDAFRDSEQFFERVKIYDDSWSQVLYVKCIEDAYSFVNKKRANKLFVDNDLSWRLFFLFIFRRFKELYVFEEGLGAYTNATEYEQANKKRSQYSNWIRRVFGMGLHYGESKYCKAIYLTKPVFYNRKFGTNRAISFKKTFRECLAENEQLLLNITGPIPECLNVSGKKVLIYATSWKIETEVLNKMKFEAHNYDLCFIKPHPHIKEIDLGNSDKIQVLKTDVMLELIISYLLNQGNLVYIWHNYSACVLHFLGTIESIPFSTRPEYEKVYNEYING